MMRRVSATFAVGIVLLALGTHHAFGQKSKKSGNEKLDTIELRCLYSFSQQVDNGEGFIVAVDSMMLETGNTHSIYYNWLEAHQDSIYNSKMPDVSTIKQLSVIKDADAFASISGSGTGSLIESYDKRETAKIYKDRGSKTVTTIDKGSSNLGTQYLKCVETISMDWEFHADTMTVAGYLCQKATTHFRGRNYNVWFTLEIPVSDGPWKFYGLPGLILKAEDDEGIFDFTAIGIEKGTGDDSIVMEEEMSIKSDYKQIEKTRLNRLSTKVLTHSDSGNLTMMSAPNPLRYYSLERD